MRKALLSGGKRWLKPRLKPGITRAKPKTLAGVLNGGVVAARRQLAKEIMKARAKKQKGKKA